MLDETLVVLTTEFGRTPDVVKERQGRNHYPKAFSSLLAGGGIRGGQKYGSTCHEGREVVRDKVPVQAFNATIAHALGMPVDHVLHSPSGRPFQVAHKGQAGHGAIRMSGLQKLWVVATVPIMIGALSAQRAIEFERDVLPIFQQRCYSCHAERDLAGKKRRIKGGLRLDGAEHIVRGGDGGRVLVPGDPEQSELFTRTILPPDHDDIMPARGEPLTDAQVTTLRSWIANGAAFGGWAGLAAPALEKDTKRMSVRAPIQREQWYADVASGLTPIENGAEVQIDGCAGRTGDARQFVATRRVLGPRARNDR